MRRGWHGWPQSCILRANSHFNAAANLPAAAAGLDAAGRNVLNFQISWSLWWALSWIFVALFGCLIIPLVFPLIVLVAWVAYGVLGAIKASNGESYRFPLTIRFFN